MLLMLIFAISLITLGFVTILVAKSKHQKWLSNLAYVPIVLGIIIAVFYLVEFVLAYFS